MVRSLIQWFLEVLSNGSHTDDDNDQDASDETNESGQYFNWITWGHDSEPKSIGVYDLDGVEDDLIDNVSVPQIGDSLKDI